ncbi:MAG TPA: copper chaperone PCu(A)C [Thiolapillus brandeum]|uniref:Copper chaperone PCu(A)C n=1 Tax=Thiolapillus brandeum TaxID=1076588 RepID=A0A831NVV9_9GAMM|nr:copper chaperone PCu(A)C [Thiolapillus brandeum]
MFKRFLTSLALGLTLASPCFAGTAADDIQIIDPWAREVPPGLTTSAGFLGMKNTGDKEHKLVAAESANTGMVELHTHINDNGVMRMRPVENIAVAPGGTTTLQPGGLHLMLMMLKKPLKSGDKMAITLEFEDGSKKEIQAEVRHFGMEKMNRMKMGH